MTSDVELLNIANRIGLVVESVSTRDAMPKTLTRGFHILNIGPRASGGTHWTGVFKGDDTVYFDSFGAPAPVKIERALGNYAFTNWVAQDVESLTCGYFVLAFGRHMTEPHADDTGWANTFVNTFGEDVNQNERIIKRLFTRLLKAK
jgi:hypothetical protein